MSMKLATIIFLTLILSLSAQDNKEKTSAENKQKKTAVMTEEVEEILKKSKKAMKIEKLATVKSMEQSINIVVANMNMQGTASMVMAQDCILIKSSFAGMQETKGYNGKIAWSENVINGFRTIEGAEKINLIGDTLPYVFHQDKFYDEIKLIGKESFKGKMCYKIELIKKGIDNTYELIDTETFLPAGSIETVVTPQGKMKVTGVLTEWKEHKEGFKFPTKMTQSMGPMTMNITFTSIKVNTKVDSKVFDPPAK